MDPHLNDLLILVLNLLLKALEVRVLDVLEVLGAAMLLLSLLRSMITSLEVHHWWRWCLPNSVLLPLRLLLSLLLVLFLFELLVVRMVLLLDGLGGPGAAVRIDFLEDPFLLLLLKAVHALK